MNRNIWIGIIVVILIVIGVWYFAGTAGTGINATSTAATSTTATTTATTSGGTGSTGSTSGTAAKKSFTSIFTQNGNYECDYTSASTSAQSSSVIYLADGKMRGEFRTTNASGTTVANLMIYTGGYLYSWKEGSSTGKKTSIRTIADLPAAIPSDLTSAAIFGTSENNVGWDCHPWARDTKLFSLPTYVKFQ